MKCALLDSGKTSSATSIFVHIEFKPTAKPKLDVSSQRLLLIATQAAVKGICVPHLCRNAADPEFSRDYLSSKIYIRKLCWICSVLVLAFTLRIKTKRIPGRYLSDGQQQEKARQSKAERGFVVRCVIMFCAQNVRASILRIGAVRRGR